jgi:acyl carrier protein
MSDLAATDIKAPIQGFVFEHARGKGITDVKDDDSLLKQGIIDSLGVFRLIAFLEDTFPLTVEDEDMFPENFQTIGDIEKFVSRKLGVKLPEPAVCEAVASPTVN